MADILNAEIIFKYFPEATDLQRQQILQLGDLYTEWNAKINVISRKDIENIYPNHILHSLAIAKFFNPVSGTSFLDMGTGGGFPGIPLAIIFPDCQFHLIDRIGKKLKVAQAIAEAIGLQNVTFQHGDIGECRKRYDYVISRAVMKLNELVPLIQKNISHNNRNTIPNGLICLKGGDLQTEIEATTGEVYQEPISEFFTESFFDTKKIIYKPL